MNTNKKNKQPKNPAENASFFNRLTLWWLNDLFKLGLTRSIEQEDIYEVLKQHKSERLSENFQKIWMDEQKHNSDPSLCRVIRKIYGRKLINSGLIRLIDTIRKIIQAICLGGLVAYFGNSDDNHSHYLYGFGIIFCTITLIIINQPYLLYTQQMGMRLRLTLSSIIYKKALRLTKSVGISEFTGQIINLMSTDVACFEPAIMFFNDIWKGAIELVVFGYFISRQIGYFGWIGIGFLALFIPLQVFIGKVGAKYRLATAKKSDARMKIMREIISGIQVIKMYCWENPFAVIVDEIRKDELKCIRGTLFLQSIISSFNIISRISTFISLMSYVYFGNVFTAQKVFIVMTYFNFIYHSVLRTGPLAFVALREALVSVKRIETFLLLPETKDDLMETKDIGLQKLLRKSMIRNIRNNKIDVVNAPNGGEMSEKMEQTRKNLLRQRNRNVNVVGKESGIIFKGVTAKWLGDDNELSNMGIENINLNIEKNSLCFIVGPVGCGKSTLLQVILGELELDDGSLTINGRLSYASQESWLFDGCIKQNILFIEDYDEERYNKVVSICALERDFDILPHGDETLVGDKGVILSGGQRARINLARAIYKKADIYLLDDPLSAVDSNVGKHIFEQCIKDFLKDKICVLVTHQLQYLLNVKHIVIMNFGNIAAQGTYHELKDTHNLVKLISDDENKEHKRQLEKRFVRKIGQVQAEHKESVTVGNIDFKVYASYFKSANSKLLLLILAALYIGTQIGISGLDLFLTKWVNWEDSLVTRESNHNVIEKIVNSGNSSSTIDAVSIDSTLEQRQKYFLIYFISVICVLYLVFQKSFGFFYICLRASRYLHDKLFRSITRATMYFFNTNPTGRILNRFSKDMGSTDTLLPVVLIDSILFLVEFCAIMIVVSIVNYWLLIPTIILCLIFYGLSRIYIKTSRCIKRIDALTRSPIYSHTNATLQGLTTIRAFNAQSVLANEFDEYQDLNTSTSYLFMVIGRAFAIWLEFICAMFMTIVIISFLLMKNDVVGGNVGLAITQLFNLLTICQFGMRQTSQLENQMTSVERIIEYTELKTESDCKNHPPSEWPTGSITFNELSMRYSENDRLVLNKLTFNIEAEEKIGIVGRTGSGKSSIIQALFRFAINEGTIKIDNIDISTIGLHDLRSKMSIIPQDPVLFSGTMRKNLDPFSERNDDAIWNALEQVELKQVITSLPDGLDCKISDGGSNFSMGQRQLVCLARAILRQNNILILDEATANVDDETDQLIQKTIRTTFRNCTVITIAHRLHTIMDCDKILVMDAGFLVEYGHPYDLIQRTDGLFRKLIDNTDKSTANRLIEIAEKNYRQITKL